MKQRRHDLYTTMWSIGLLDQRASISTITLSHFLYIHIHQVEQAAYSNKKNGTSFPPFLFHNLSIHPSRSWSSNRTGRPMKFPTSSSRRDSDGRNVVPTLQSTLSSCQPKFQQSPEVTFFNTMHPPKKKNMYIYIYQHRPQIAWKGIIDFPVLMLK